jgi:hypothetical protein
MADDENRFHSRDPEVFERYLKGCVILAGEGDIDFESEEDEVAIAVIHDGGGFTPGAAIHVSELGSTQDALEQAFDALREHTIEHYPDHVKDLQEEWGDEWDQILVESFDGTAFTLSPQDAARVIINDKFAHQHVTIST